MTKEKLNWIDNLKVLGILAVILGHINSPFGSFIYSWHMPLFFIIAGFFIKCELSIKEFIIKDFKRLMVPYFIFAFIGLIIETVKRIVLHREGLEYLHELKGVFIWMDMPSLMNTYGFVLWFLPALFFSRVILVTILKYFRNLFIQFVLVCGLFSISFIAQLPFGMDNTLNAILFVFIGNTFFKYYQNIKLFYILPFIVILLYFVYGIPILDLANKNYENAVINIFWAISIIFIFITIFKKIDLKNKLLTIWGGNTMLLFIIHPYTNNIAHIVVEKLHFGDWYLKFIISIILLEIILLLKQRFENKGIFKYV